MRALEYIGGVPRLIVPDQTRALIKYPDRYDPEPNRSSDEFASHYGCAILAARPAHPRDKPKVEGSVLHTRDGRLFDELQVAHGDGSFARRLTQLAKLDLLVIDDFATPAAVDKSAPRATDKRFATARFKLIVDD